MLTCGIVGDANTQRTLILELLRRLAESLEITSSQFAAGFERVYASIPDLALDVPNAAATVAEYDSRRMRASAP